MVITLLTLILVLGLCACGNKNQDDANDKEMIQNETIVEENDTVESTQQNDETDEGYTDWNEYSTFAVWSYDYEAKSDDFKFKAPYGVELSLDKTRGKVFADEEGRVIFFLPQSGDSNGKKDLNSLFETQKDEIITVIHTEFDDFENIQFKIDSTNQVKINSYDMVEYQGKLNCIIKGNETSIPLMGYSVLTEHEAYVLWFMIDTTDMNDFSSEGAQIIKKVAESYKPE